MGKDSYFVSGTVRKESKVPNTGTNVRISQMSKQPNNPKSILSTVQRYPNLLKVYHYGIDVTPKPINPLTYKGAKERQINIYELGASAPPTVNEPRSASRVFQPESTLKLQPTEGYTVHGDSVFMPSVMDSNSVLSQDVSSQQKSEESEIELVRPIIAVKMPKHISLVLNETCTNFILDLPSCTAEKESEEGIAVEKENKEYEYLTVGKGKNRRVINAEVQTVKILLKTRDTDARKIVCKNSHSFASLWDMYDTFAENDMSVKDESRAPSVTLTETPNVLVSTATMDSYLYPKEDSSMTRICKLDKFQDALCIIERLLANNVYNEQQKRYKGLSDPSPFREGIEYNYTLNFLWTFSNLKTEGRCVTAMCWNSINKDICAAGYGKFFYDETTTGMVLIWNIKNPVQPEREYNFPEPVTSLAFSKQQPNLLAIGFYDGYVLVLDISTRKIRPIGHADKNSCPLFEPVWQLDWYTDHDYYKGKEFLAATCQDGRICKFQLTTQSMNMFYGHMMRVTRAEGKLKGIETLRKCPLKGIPISRYPAALVYTPHPVDPNIYFVGTSEGVVHRCSKNYYHQHLDLFLAHDAPMYAIKFSPFCDKLFLTCGDDWAARLWADGISEPLFELKKTMTSVQDVAWSPALSTIIATISGTDIFIWDLQRKTYNAQSTTKSPTKSRNTLVKFTEDGRCLLVADLDGNIHVFALEDMPFPAFFQNELLTQSVKNALIIRPDLLKKIEKLGTLSYDKSQYKKYFN